MIVLRQHERSRRATHPSLWHAGFTPLTRIFPGRTKVGLDLRGESRKADIPQGELNPAARHPGESAAWRILRPRSSPGETQALPFRLEVADVDASRWREERQCGYAPLGSAMMELRRGSPSPPQRSGPLGTIASVKEIAPWDRQLSNATLKTGNDRDGGASVARRTAKCAGRCASSASCFRARPTCVPTCQSP